MSSNFPTNMVEFNRIVNELVRGSKGVRQALRRSGRHYLGTFRGARRLLGAVTIRCPKAKSLQRDMSSIGIKFAWYVTGNGGNSATRRGGISTRTSNKFVRQVMDHPARIDQNVDPTM